MIHVTSALERLKVIRKRRMNTVTTQQRCIIRMCLLFFFKCELFIFFFSVKDLCCAFSQLSFDIFLSHSICYQCFPLPVYWSHSSTPICQNTVVVEQSTAFSPAISVQCIFPSSVFKSPCAGDDSSAPCFSQKHSCSTLICHPPLPISHLSI